MLTSIRGIHKPCEQLKGRPGISQMAISLNKLYLVKVSKKVGGGQKYQKSVHVIYGWPPLYISRYLPKIIVSLIATL